MKCYWCKGSGQWYLRFARKFEKCLVCNGTGKIGFIKWLRAKFFYFWDL